MIDKDDIPEDIPLDPEIEPDIDDDDLDDEDIQDLKETYHRLQKYISQRKWNTKNYTKERKKLIGELKKTVTAVDFLLLAKASMNSSSYPEFIKNHEKLRKSFFKAIIGNLDQDAQVIILQDILREIIGDDEPSEHYIN